MTLGEAKAYRLALDHFIRSISGNAVEVNQFVPILYEWKPDAYETGDIRRYDGQPYSCVTSHDSTANPNWTPADAPSLWRMFHGTTPETARPWVQPLGAHDMYRKDEFMIWEDGKLYHCLTGTAYSPHDYPQAWEVYNDISNNTEET